MEDGCTSLQGLDAFQYPGGVRRKIQGRGGQASTACIWLEILDLGMRLCIPDERAFSLAIRHSDRRRCVRLGRLVDSHTAGGRYIAFGQIALIVGVVSHDACNGDDGEAPFCTFHSATQSACFRSRSCNEPYTNCGPTGRIAHYRLCLRSTTRFYQRRTRGST